VIRRAKRWRRHGDVVPLGKVTAEASEHVERLQILDTLGDDAKSERMAELDRGPDEIEVSRLLGGDEAADEGAVQLELADCEIAQVGERGEAGAEVVDRHGQAEVPQLFDDGFRSQVVRDDAGFGDLEHQ
jgi:hypothetical protein